MPPVNDNVASRQVLSGDSGSITPVTIDDATTEPSEPIGSDVSDINQSVWFEWTAPADGVAVFDTLGSVATDGNGDSHGGLDTTLAAWTATDPTDFATYVESDSDDDDPTLSGGHFTSRISFLAASGVTYLIQLGTFDTPYAGSAHLNWSLTPYSPDTDNDSCADSITLSGSSGHRDADTQGWAGVWPTGADPIFEQFGHGGQPLWWKWTNSGSSQVQFKAVFAPSPRSDRSSSSLYAALMIGACGSLVVDLAVGHFVKTAGAINPNGFPSTVDVILQPGDTVFLEVEIDADTSEPPGPPANGRTAYSFDWTIAPVSTQDCIEDAISLGDPLDGRTTMTRQLFPSGGGSISTDATRFYHSILVGDVLYWAMEVDYYDPFTGVDDPSTYHFDFVVGKINTDGTGLVTHVVDAHRHKDFDVTPGKNVIHGSGGGFPGGELDTGEMRLLWDGNDVVVAIMTKEGVDGGFTATRYYVDLYREDGGSWTHITELVSPDCAGADTFQSFQATASPAAPGTIWLGMAGLRLPPGGGLEDRFTRYAIDVATGVATALHDDFTTSATVAGLGVVSAGEWELCSDEGYPILIWNKNGAYANDNPDGYPIVSEDRAHYDPFLSVERFDTKAPIATITSAQVTSGTVVGAYAMPGSGIADGTGVRSRQSIRTWGRFFCAETGRYERFLAVNYQTVVGGVSTNPEKWLCRLKSDFTAVPRPIDSLAFNSSPGHNPQTFNPISSQYTWGWQQPLYDGARNVWEVGIANFGDSFAMFQYDRRCNHEWLDALIIEGSVGIDSAQDGGWDADGYFYVCNGDFIPNDYKIWKIGPIVRDCINCIPITPLSAGLYAWQTF